MHQFGYIERANANQQIRTICFNEQYDDTVCTH